MQHLRFSGLPFERQRDAFEAILRADPLVMAALAAARDLDLPGWRVVSGALYDTVWNALTNRPSGHGIKDVDLFYYDASDLSWDAEDQVIRRAEPVFAHLPLPVEVRNQARVHLWYENHFGQPYPPLASCEEGIDRFACTTHAVGVRLSADEGLDLYAPFGLDDLFSFRLVPNRVLDNRATHEKKAARALPLWPELTVEPW